MLKYSVSLSDFPGWRVFFVRNHSFHLIVCVSTSNRYRTEPFLLSCAHFSTNTLSINIFCYQSIACIFSDILLASRFHFVGAREDDVAHALARLETPDSVRALSVDCGPVQRTVWLLLYDCNYRLWWSLSYSAWEVSRFIWIGTCF